MRVSYAVSDWFYRFTHVLKRNRSAVLIYTLLSVVFIVIGVAVGIKVGNKPEYISRNHAPLFSFLRGEKGAASYFFTELILSEVYGALASSLFFFRVTAYLSIVPCLYCAYTIGLDSCVILSVYGGAALPLIFVFFVPVCLVEVGIICILSHKCLAFNDINCRVLPTRSDVFVYARSCIPFCIALFVCALVKTLSLILFGSSLIGMY